MFFVLFFYNGQKTGRDWGDFFGEWTIEEADVMKGTAELLAAAESRENFLDIHGQKPERAWGEEKGKAKVLGFYPAPGSAQPSWTWFF